jgi:hypothetical protein
MRETVTEKEMILPTAFCGALATCRVAGQAAAQNSLVRAALSRRRSRNAKKETPASRGARNTGDGACFEISARKVTYEDVDA